MNIEKKILHTLRTNDAQQNDIFFPVFCIIRLVSVRFYQRVTCIVHSVGEKRAFSFAIHILNMLLDADYDFCSLNFMFF